MTSNSIITFQIGLETFSFTVTNIPIYEKSEKGETGKIDYLLTEEGVAQVIKSYMERNKMKGKYHNIIVYNEQKNIIAQADNLNEMGSLMFTDNNV